MKNVIVFLFILVVFTACTPRKQMQYSKKDSPLISANLCPLVTKNHSTPQILQEGSNNKLNK